MVKKTQTTSVNQTAIGNDNIQVVGSNNVITRITNFFAGDTEQQRALKNRRAMLALVRNTWIKGVLEKSLYNEVLIELGMEERPDAVDHPWEMQVQMPDRINRTLPAGASMIDVFAEMDDAMLILGEPGSGKTTMLLELARDCIARAEQDDNQSIPVVFNLSSWGGKQIIDDWLVNELRTKYNVPQKTARNWVEKGDLQLLLDGLDEVKRENREACVKAINDFRQMHGLTVPIAVCSRLADYEALSAKVNLKGAILLQPLTSQQIDEYFEQAGPELKGVWQTLKNDEVLQELVKQPLVLSILTLAYHGRVVDANASEPLHAIDTSRKQLFDIYIQKMFDRIARTKNEPYSPEQARTRLAWLARKMIDHNQSSYMVEQMQPTWLNNEDQVMTYRGIASAVFFMVFLTIGNIKAGPVWELAMVQAAIIFTLAFYAWLSFNPKVYMLARGVFHGILNQEIDNEVSTIRTVDLLILNWKNAFVGFGIGGFTVIAYLLTQKWFSTSQIDPYSLIFLPIATSIMLGLNVQKLVQETKPGQRLFLTAKNFLAVFLLISVGIGIIYTLLGHRITTGMIPLNTALLLGMIFGLFYGGFTIIQHYVLRFVMAISGLLPWRLFSFLDYCTERIFLRRVGGGYIFVHRLLMEHFAAMYQEVPK